MILKKRCCSCKRKKDIRFFNKALKEKDQLAHLCKHCNKKKLVDFHLMTKYNLTLSQYNEILISQNYKCALCEIHSEKTTRKLAVDHCHKTGKIRGLLCMNCNSGIGKLQDSIELLKKAIDYLSK